MADTWILLEHKLRAPLSHFELGLTMRDTIFLHQGYVCLYCPVHVY